MKIKPVGYHLDFKYNCPNCGSDLWATEEEAKTPGFRFVCCGKALVLEPIQESSVKLTFQKTKNKTLKPNANQAVEALCLLSEMGFVGNSYEKMAYELATDGYSAKEIFKQCVASKDV